MMFKNNTLVYGTLLLCLPSLISANLTTLQHWDPIPFFNAVNLSMPPDTQFCYAVKQRLVDENADTKHRRWGLNVSPFVQRAIRAQQTDNLYFGVHGAATITGGQQMSDFQGTPSLMGLFLGQDINGNSIWGGPAAIDTGVVTDITQANLDNMSYLPTNLKSAIAALNNIPTTITTTPPDYNYAIIDGTAINPDATPPNTAPSILSQSVLEQDKIYFGAFSVPLTYQKAGFRWELNFDISDSVGFIARGGFCQITQRALPAQSLSASSTEIYQELNNVINGDTPSSGKSQAQATFNQWVPNNIEYLLDPTNGADYDITTFSDTGIEDIQLLAFVRHPFTIHPVDPNTYASMIVTPYAMIGWTIPIAPVRDYYQLYSLPLGNNSHTSIGGVLGLTFDFLDSVEFGFEFGSTCFLQKVIDEVPCPNHQLQRVLYPYRQKVNYSPGFNSQFAVIFNAYEFMHNTSFSFRYNYVQHNQDTITLETPSQYFFPNMLEEKSMWVSQMFVAALTFEIQPSIFVSMAWQGALAQKNAYCSNTILASLSFLF